MSPAPGARRATVESGIGQAGIDLSAAPRKDAGRSPASRLFLALLGLLGVLVFLGLGIWQLERRVWKLDLIARVDQRIHAPVADAPGPGAWAGMTAASGEYSHVRLAGHFLGGANTLMMGRVMWNEFFNNTDWPMASAVTCVMVLLLLVPLALFQYNQVKQQELATGGRK